MALFTITGLGTTATEGSPFSFMVTPDGALNGAHTVRWEIIPVGRLAATSGDFSALGGELSFLDGAVSGQVVTLPIIDDGLRALERSFAVRLTQVDGDDVETPIGDDHVVVLVDDDGSSAGSFATINLANSDQHDQLVLGSSYEYRVVSGGSGNDALMVTRHQIGDVEIGDTFGSNVVKFDGGVVITGVNENALVFPGFKIVRSIELTLETGGVVTVSQPSGLEFQLGEGEVVDYDGFYAAITAGGFVADTTDPSILTTELTSPIVIPFPGGGDDASSPSTSLFSVSGLGDTATEGTAYSFMVTPDAALNGAHTVRWEIIPVGRLAATSGDFSALSGELSFLDGAVSGQAVTLPIIDDGLRALERSFAVRLTQVDGDDVETPIGDDHVVVLVDDDGSSAGSFATINLANSDQHDQLVLGSSYEYRVVSGGSGNDALMVTRHQIGDVEIGDTFGSNVVKFDGGVVITGVNENALVFPGFKIVRSIELTLETGGVVTVSQPSGLEFQLGEGEVVDYDGFYASITAGGFVADATDPSILTTELTSPIEIPFPGGERTGLYFVPDGADADDEDAWVFSDGAGSLEENTSGTGIANGLLVGTLGHTEGEYYFTTDISGSFLILDDDGNSNQAGAVNLRYLGTSTGDFEAGDQLSLTVMVHESGGTVVETVTYVFNLTNVDDSDVALEAGVSTPAAEGTTDIALTVTASDADNVAGQAPTETITYTLDHDSTLDLLAATDGVTVIGGASAGDEFGLGLGQAGDVDGDGIADIVIGAFKADVGSGVTAGSAYVVFGQSGGLGADVDLDDLDGTNGFTLTTGDTGDNTGFAVSGGGDVNNDGYDDLLVGAYENDEAHTRSGSLFVIYGKDGGFSASYDLENLTAGDGTHIFGRSGNDRVGGSVASAGDFNNDGIADFIFGAQAGDRPAEDDPTTPEDESGNVTNTGEAYVIYGKTGGFGDTFNLDDFSASDGVVFYGEDEHDNAGRVVSGAGDLNDDGFDDIIIGARDADDNSQNSGAVYVVYGRGDGAFAGGELDLADLDGANGFKVIGASREDRLGISLSSAGDVNDDGIADIILGAAQGDEGGSNSGEAYVLFGQRGGFGPSVDLTALDGSNGYRIIGAEGDDRLGFAVSGIGDFNGDGIDDVLVSAPQNDGGGGDAGAAYVIYGKAGGYAADLDVDDLDGSNGFAITGASAGDEAGRAVSAAGDVNDDGYADLLVGATKADLGNGASSGAAYVIYGRSSLDNALFEIDASTGAIRFREGGDADHEARPDGEYTVRVGVSSSSTLSGEARPGTSRDYTVTVADGNDAPTGFVLAKKLPAGG